MTVYSLFDETIITKPDDLKLVINGHTDYDKLIKTIPSTINLSNVCRFCACIDGCDFVVFGKEPKIKVIEFGI
jgi:hypothetical protein